MNRNGFTLVELTIVLMIIGLLLGGVLRGQELLSNARISSTVQQVKAYQGAYNTFVDIYSNIPGDMPNAMTKLPGCTTQNKCQNGNGNARLDNSSGYNGGDADQAWAPISSAITSENAQFWKMLALAHLITGVDPSASQPEWGKSQPEAKVSAGFFARYADGIGTQQSSKAGTTLVLRKSITGNGYDCGNSGEFCAISPQNAALLDRKMDDGLASTGEMRGVSADYWSHGCGAPNAGVNGPTGYNETMEQDVCEVFFNGF